jgi:hypothetical protein
MHATLAVHGPDWARSALKHMVTDELNGIINRGS